MGLSFALFYILLIPDPYVCKKTIILKSPGDSTLIRKGGNTTIHYLSQSAWLHEVFGPSLDNSVRHKSYRGFAAAYRCLSGAFSSTGGRVHCLLFRRNRQADQNLLSKWTLFRQVLNRIDGVGVCQIIRKKWGYGRNRA